MRKRKDTNRTQNRTIKFTKMLTINIFGEISNIPNGYRNVNMEVDDLVQEGCIGLYRTIMAYSDKVDCSFKTFFYLCAKRQLYTSLRTHTRQKHKPLNQYMPLKYGREDMGIDIEDTRARPEDAVKLRFSGYKYKEIAKRLKLDEHKVKKALERGKYKLRKYLRRIYDEYT